MSDDFISRGFGGKRRDSAQAERIPPGQYLTGGFPVLSAGPTPQIPLESWQFKLETLTDDPKTWSWDEFNGLPFETFTTDIHCVTTWSKLDTTWRGVSVDTLLGDIDTDYEGQFVTAYSYGGYTTNLPLQDLIDGKAWVATHFDNAPLTPEHGGPARLVVPHLYFWKSAKWIAGFKFMEDDEPGFWESLGYHNRGDPWKEERYSGD